MSTNPRLPVSTRHAFALAFDLAVRRDALHSVVVPLLLRAPWIIALAVLPTPDLGTQSASSLALRAVAVLGDMFMLLLVGGMLRYRARSVFNTPTDVHPMPVLECYARGLRRVPWLLVTETVRNLSIVFATFFFVVPALFLGFRLSCATEAVVLDDQNLADAFQRSFRLTEGRFERWLEMIVVSVLLILSVTFVGAIVWLAAGLSATAGIAVLYLLITAITPVIQYAWTFFYMRLVESDVPGTASDSGRAADTGSGAWATGSSARLALVKPADPASD